MDLSIRAFKRMLIVAWAWDIDLRQCRHLLGRLLSAALEALLLCVGLPEDAALEVMNGVLVGTTTLVICCAYIALRVVSCSSEAFVRCQTDAAAQSA